MNVDVRTTADFDRSFHKLSKKYKSLRKDLQNFVEGLKNGSARGDEVIKGVFKYRLAITSKGTRDAKPFYGMEFQRIQQMMFMPIYIVGVTPHFFIFSI